MCWKASHPSPYPHLNVESRCVPTPHCCIHIQNHFFYGWKVDSLLRNMSRMLAWSTHHYIHIWMWKVDAVQLSILIPPCRSHYLPPRNSPQTLSDERSMTLFPLGFPPRGDWFTVNNLAYGTNSHQPSSCPASKKIILSLLCHHICIMCSAVWKMLANLSSSR